MKKLLILIGLVGFISIQAQDIFYWEIRSDGKSDTTTYDKRAGEPNWFGAFVTIDVTVWNLEDTTSVQYFGGFDPRVSVQTGKQDFKYIPNDDMGVDIDPLLIDTVSCTYLRPNADSSRYGFMISYENFPFPRPAHQHVMNTCDSVEYYIKFTGEKR